VKEHLDKLLKPPRAHAGLKTAGIIFLGLAINIAALFLHTKASSPSGVKKTTGPIPAMDNAPVTQNDKASAEKIAAESDTPANVTQSAEDNFSTNSMAALATLAGTLTIEKRIPVDLTGITDINEKVSKIFNAFLENARNNKMISFPSPYADQMAELGAAAVPELLKMLEECMKADPFSEDGGQENFNKQKFLAEALGQVLTDQNKDVILQYFDKYGMFAGLVAKYRFPEADAMIFNKLESGYPMRDNMYGNYKDDRDLIDAALAVDEEQTVALLIEQLRQGNSSESALERMAHIQDLDLREPLREAAANSKGDYDRQILLKPMLELGMNEGLDLALALLKSDQEWTRNNVRDLLPNYTGVLGSTDEMTAWLEIHRNELAWNPESRRYELKTGL